MALKLHTPRFSTLAYQVKLDAFTRVKKAIDDVFAQLRERKGDEIKQGDFCTDEFNKNTLQTRRKERVKQDLAAKIEYMDGTLKAFAQVIETLQAELPNCRSSSSVPARTA